MCSEQVGAVTEGDAHIKLPMPSILLTTGNPQYEGVDKLSIAPCFRTKRIQDRPVEIRQFSLSSDFDGCQILFLSSALRPDVQAEVIRRVSGKHILLVGDSDGFLEQGGVINSVVEDNRVRLYIARKTADRQGLAISSKLLQVARVVDYQ